MGPGGSQPRSHSAMVDVRDGGGEDAAPVGRRGAVDDAAAVLRPAEVEPGPGAGVDEKVVQ